MDIPETVLKDLKCNSCEEFLSRSPVYLQHDGAAVCNQCYTPENPATRNTQYEATAKLLKFPCKNRELGCFITVPFVEEAEVIAHEKVCEHREYNCPVLGPARCYWVGPKAAILAHCRDFHPNNVFDNPCSLIHDIARPRLYNYIISAFQLLFLLHVKICEATGKIIHCVRLLGDSAETANFFYNLDIKRNNEHISKEGQVEPEGCLTLEEDISLTLKSKSLQDVLGGLDGAKFILTVRRRIKRRLSDEDDDQLTMTVAEKSYEGNSMTVEACDSTAVDTYKRMAVETGELVEKSVRCAVEKCCKCGVNVSVFLYRDDKGWRCERCVPPRRACEMKTLGCTHTDVDLKCRTHERYFCQHRVECRICQQKVTQGSLSEHYVSTHHNIKYRTAGFTWRVSYRDGWSCFSSSVVGTALCYDRLTSSQFGLYIRSTLPREQLHEYRCEVRVTNPDTGYTRIFSLNAKYNKDYDWGVLVKKEMFLLWNNVFDVCVDFRKCST